MFSLSSIILGVIFGAIGVGYIIYGKNERRGMALLMGVTLCVYPYFVTSIILSIIIGLALMSVPMFVKA
jgi:hypothetical protein